jgi:hypothetical protein
MSKSEDLNKGDLIKADLYSRPNATNGKYRIGRLGLDNLEEIKSNDIFLLETLKMKADLADKVILDAESQGKNTLDPKIMQELGEQINSVGVPIYKSESIITWIINSFSLMMYYGIAVGIWGLVFGRSLTFSFLYGISIGLLINILFGGTVAFQRTRERIKEMSLVVFSLWGNFAIVAGIIGLFVLIIKLLI